MDVYGTNVKKDCSTRAWFGIVFFILLYSEFNSPIHVPKGDQVRARWQGLWDGMNRPGSGDFCDGE